MPKGFTEKERCIIQEKLLMEGQKAFEYNGFQKTSVATITESVGIAKGSFYLFYASKEALFIDILERIEDNIHAQMLEEARISRLSGKDLFSNMLKTRMREAIKEPIIKMALDKNLNQKIMSKLPKERMQANIEKDRVFIQKIIDVCPAAEILMQYPSDQLAGIFRSLFLLILHKDEIGDTVFQDVLDFFVDGVVDKLFSDL